MHVTVLLAVYNGADFVRTSMESIIEQTYHDWDLLIVDDASTDETPALLHNLAAKERRITVIRNKANYGLATSLNIGWRQAQGELIARADADDWSSPRRLACQVEFMERHPEVAVLGTGAALVDELGRSLGIALRPEQHEVLTREIYKKNPFIHPSVMMRRNFLTALGGYDERLRRSQDYDLWLRGYRCYHYHNLPEVLIRYKVHRRLSLQAIVSGTFVLGRAAYREGRLLTRGWYALRWLSASLLTKFGLYESRLS
jgi:GT2 family glycosyltransferase